MSEFVDEKLSDLYIESGIMVGIAMLEESMNHLNVPNGMSQAAFDAAVEPLKPLLAELRKSCLGSIDENKDELIAHVKRSTQKGLTQGWSA
tara:strand:+ start:2380 stop:2652 length:273 start_codon:yes stop_codon:yes gene_type:complete